MFKNVILYRCVGLADVTAYTLEDRAQACPFLPCGATQTQSWGWTPPRAKHGLLVEAVGGALILNMTFEHRSVPAAAAKEALNVRLDKIEQDTGRRPRGKAAKELKEEVVLELLPRAFPKRSTVPVWIDADRGLIVVGATSVLAADSVATRLVELLGSEVSLQLLQPARNAVTSMAHWLLEQVAPAGFTVDRECELKQPDSEKAAVRYTRHTLDTEEVAEHIRQGKLPTQLAMTWDSRVSFVLTDAFVIKRLALLDVVLEGKGDADADAFDADVAITTGELSRLFPALLEAAGGEAALDLVSAAAVTPKPTSGDDDELLDKARMIVVSNKHASISLVQRHLSIGYNRAARLLEHLEAAHVVGAMDTKGNREVLEVSA